MQELFAASPMVFAGAVFAFALLIGSFLNVVIHRLPIMMEREWREQCEALARQPAAEPLAELQDEAFNLVVPRSRCPACGHPITALQNIPVISYLALGGRCAGCRTAISPRYPLVEFVSALLSAWVAMHFGFGIEALMAVAFTLALVPITMIDFDHQLIPDSIVLPLMWVGLIMSLFHPLDGATTLFISPRNAIIGAVAGYMTFWTVYQVFRLLTGKEGMGYGDFKLLAALGAWLGWQALPTIIMMSALVGAVTGILLMVFKGRDHKIPMPFGPFLAAAGWITMLYGDAIRQAYVNLMF
ncbi:MAG: A24 family peptidase [Woeseiaceae bacterium]|jgi:leader peptidase (prepilin peptidase)/N-methyltransferase|nr:A24 family peptidase [Woeseiaceae bacterium]